MTIQNILQGIREKGFSDAQIGIEIDAAQSIVTRLRNGIHKTTDFERGKKIHDLGVKLGVVDSISTTKKK